MAIVYRPQKTQEIFLSCPADIAIYGGAAGGGKASHIDTLIPTPNGIKLLGSISDGDVVFDERGRQCRVVKAHDAFVPDECYRIAFDDGSTIDCCSDHLWFTYTASDLEKSRRRDPYWMERRRMSRPSRAKFSQGALKSNMVIERNEKTAEQRRDSLDREPLGSVKTTREIADTLTLKSGRKNHAIPVCGALEMPEADLPLDPYLLGVWLGDGTTQDGTITTADCEIVDAFASAGFSVKHYTKYTWGVNGLRRKLREIGVFCNKHVPELYMRASAAQRLALLQGLFDTDGTAKPNTARAIFYSKLEHLANSAFDLAVSLGMKPTLTTKRAKFDGRDYGICHMVAVSSDLPLFRLTRKLDRIAPARSVSRFRYIVSCERIPSVPMRCLTVDSPSRLYLIGRTAIPTHNTFALLFEMARHYRNPNWGGVIFRHEAKQILNEGGLRDSAMEIYPGLGADYRSQPMPTFTFPSGARVSFSHINLDSEVAGWQGSQIPTMCVAKGTSVLMGDGSYIPIEHIKIGDKLMTLEGPRLVTKTFLPRFDECVLAEVFDGSGNKIGEQEHPVSHRFLTGDGDWVSYSCIRNERVSLPSSTCESILCRDDRIQQSRVLPKSRSSSRTSTKRCSDHLQQTEQYLQSRDPLSSAAISLRLKGEEICCEASCDGLRESSRPLTLCVPVALHEHRLREAISLLDFRLQDCANGCVPICSSKADFRYCCYEHLYLCDERPLDQSSSGQDAFPSRDDAVGQNHRFCKTGDACHTQTHNLYNLFEYVHPYTKERRFSSEGVHVGSCVMTPIGNREVFDICVDEVNHYITKSGLVNKNCFDELCHFSSYVFFYMLSRNRSACGVKPYVRASCNPDPDSWVADFIAWWIDQETGYPIKERGGKIRHFIRRPTGSGMEIVWGDTKDDVAKALGFDRPKDREIEFANEQLDAALLRGEDIPDDIASGPVQYVKAIRQTRSLSFVPSSVYDNAALLSKDPGYLANLKSLDRVEQARLLGGNWKVRAAAGLYFPTANVQIVPKAPQNVIQWLRQWDLAATEPNEMHDPDWTVGLKIGRTWTGTVVIGDVIRVRKNARFVRDLVKATALADGRGCWIGLIQDPGQAGKGQFESYRDMLRGYSVFSCCSNKKKELTAEPVAAEWQGNNVVLVLGDWNRAFIDELEKFPTKGVHDDQVDALSNGYALLPPVGQPNYAEAGGLRRRGRER